MKTHLLQKGYILIVAVVFFAIFLGIAAALVSYVTLYAKGERYTVARQEALGLAEAGFDEAVYALNQNPSYTGETNTPLGDGTFTVAVTSIDTNTKLVTVTATVPDPQTVKIIKGRVSLSSNVISFHYGIQSGTGGISLANSSSIIGNVFSAGPVTGSGNMIYGDVVSTGASGIIYGIHATSSAYAHTIGSASQSTTIDKNAYYATTITNTTVGGTRYASSSDLASVALPISDDQITEWEGFAEEGGIISNCDNSGNYTITSSVSLGPIKIACNLVIKSSSAVVTITGPIWVTGNITLQTGPTLQMSSSLGSQNVAIIADNPSAETTSGVINVGQSTQFLNSGTTGSFVFLISQNDSVETGGSNTAISLSQGASALVAYAAHGLITLAQSVAVKEVTGYQISLSQSANVTYDTGLPSTVFQSGPGGGWSFVPGTYSIAQ
jgi:hypothetical protein